MSSESFKNLSFLGKLPEFCQNLAELCQISEFFSDLSFGPNAQKKSLPISIWASFSPVSFALKDSIRPGFVSHFKTRVQSYSGNRSFRVKTEISALLKVD